MSASAKQIEYFEKLRDIITSCEESGDSARQGEKRRAEAKINALIRECPGIIEAVQSAADAREDAQSRLT